MDESGIWSSSVGKSTLDEAPAVYKEAASIEAAIADREELLRADPDLRLPQNVGLRRKLIELYGKKWNLIDLS